MPSEHEDLIDQMNSPGCNEGDDFLQSNKETDNRKKMKKIKVARQLQAGTSAQEILKKRNELAGTKSRDCMLNGADISNIRYSLLNNKRTKIDFGLLEKYQEKSNVEEDVGLDVDFSGDTDIISSPESLDKAREHFFVQHRKLFDFIHKCTNAKTIDHITEKIIRLMN